MDGGINMYCKECGEKYGNEKAVICVKCGTSKGQGNSFCPECGVEVKNKDAEVCLSCGVRLKGAMNNITSQIKNAANKGSSSCTNNNKLVAGLLALFLGGLGIHRFYLGYKEIGFIQLGIFALAFFIFAPIIWGCWIWAIIDAVKIFSGKLNNASGMELV